MQQQASMEPQMSAPTAMMTNKCSAASVVKVFDMVYNRAWDVAMRREPSSNDKTTTTTSTPAWSSSLPEMYHLGKGINNNDPKHKCYYCENKIMCEPVKNLFHEDCSNTLSQQWEAYHLNTAGNLRPGYVDSWAGRSSCILTASKMPYISGAQSYFKRFGDVVADHVIQLTRDIVPPMLTTPANKHYAKRKEQMMVHINRGVKHEHTALAAYERVTKHKILPMYKGSNPRQRTFVMNILDLWDIAYASLNHIRTLDETLQLPLAIQKRDSAKRLETLTSLLTLIDRYLCISYAHPELDDITLYTPISPLIQPLLGSTPDAITYCGIPVEVKCPNRMMPSNFSRYSDQVALQNLTMKAHTSHFVQYDVAEDQILVTQVNMDIPRWLWGTGDLFELKGDDGGNGGVVLDENQIPLTNSCGMIENIVEFLEDVLIRMNENLINKYLN